jgi:hypothetical protein
MVPKDRRIRSNDEQIREKNQVIKDLRRKLSEKILKLSEKKLELSEKNSVVNNLKRKIYVERIQFNQERQKLEKEWEEERLLNTKLTRKYRNAKRRAHESRENTEEVRQALDAFAGVGPNGHPSVPMNDLCWLFRTGNMHLIKYENREKIGLWLHDAKMAMEDSPEDTEDSAPEHLEDKEDTAASTTVTVVTATRT